MAPETTETALPVSGGAPYVVSGWTEWTRWTGDNRYEKNIGPPMFQICASPAKIWTVLPPIAYNLT